MNKPTTEGGTSSTELRIIVWQFVRIMVQLETVARARGRAKAPTVFADWRAAWTEIDRTLTRLADSDAEAFSDLMMNQEVVVRCRDKSQVNEVTRAIENVMNQLDQQIRAVRGEAKAEEELRFERREMNALLKHLRKTGRGGGARKSASATQTRKIADATLSRKGGTAPKRKTGTKRSAGGRPVDDPAGDPPEGGRSGDRRRGGAGGKSASPPRRGRKG